MLISKWKWIFLLLLTQNIFAQNITHGPMIGGVTENSARIYIRTSSAVNFSLEYSTDSTFSTFQQINSATDANLDTSKIVTLENLAIFTDYYFRYRINGNIENTTGHFKTFPVVGAT